MTQDNDRPSSTGRLLALLRQYVAPYRKLLAIAAATQLIGTLAFLHLPAVNAAIIDHGVAKGDIATIVQLGAVMLAVSGLQVVCSVVAARIGSRAAAGLGRDLRSAMVQRVTGFSTQQVAKFGAPSLLTRTVSDVQQIQQVVLMACMTLVTAAVTGIGGIILAAGQDTGVSWVLLVSVPVVALATYLIMSRTLLVCRNLPKLLDDINRIMREQLSGIRVIRAFAREPFERQRFAAANVELSNTTLATLRLDALFGPVTTFVISASSVALVWFGGLRIDAGQMQVGTLVALVSYAAQILGAVLMMSIVLVQLPRAAACAERVSEILSTSAAIQNPEQPATQGPVSGRVCLDGAAFRHPGADQAVLQDISFTATPGTTTAIVGSTGAGKSTLISLLSRLHDVTDGSVTFDGVDIRDYDLEQLRSAIGLVPQQAHLFSGTVADNLRYGAAPGQVVTDAEMWEALRIAAADDFVRAHPEGLQMPVAQAGTNLSGGQRQRVAIARAVIRRPAVYLFDDAFSALDAQTHARVREALREVTADSTVITVSQRISDVADADQVIVVNDGTLVGSGTHESLLADCPTYAEFVESQAGVGIAA